LCDSIRDAPSQLDLCVSFIFRVFFSLPIFLLWTIFNWPDDIKKGSRGETPLEFMFSGRGKTLATTMAAQQLGPRAILLVSIFFRKMLCCLSVERGCFVALSTSILLVFSTTT